MISIKKLEWDSEFFGYEIGSIKLESNDVFDFDSIRQNLDRFKLVYIFSENSIENKNINLVDKKVILKRHSTIKESTSKGAKIELFNLESHDFNELKSLALLSGQFSRFKIDKNFVNNEYEALYSHWIEKSVNPDSGIETFVSTSGSKIHGFITLYKKSDFIAEIGLIAVSKDSRGLGIGRCLVEYAISKSNFYGCKTIQVSTQFDNKPAMRLYLSSNFEITTITPVYHLWKA